MCGPHAVADHVAVTVGGKCGILSLFGLRLVHLDEPLRRPRSLGRAASWARRLGRTPRAALGVQIVLH